MKDADFSGWATKAGLECSDGRTIMGGAFEHQDQVKVPLVWMHGHDNPENVLGHAILESRPEGVWCWGFFNKTAKAAHARELLEHEDINQMSIWANSLVERAKKVFHGAIKEVSLVLAGANPGALIQNVNIRHSDGYEEMSEEDAIIYTGFKLEIGHSEPHETEQVVHADETDDDEVEESLRDVYDTLNEKQKNVLHYMLAQAVKGNLSHALEDADDPTFKTIYEEMDDEQKTLLHYLLGEASAKAAVSHSDVDSGTDDAAGTDGTDGTGTDGTEDTGTDGAADAAADGADDAGNDGTDGTATDTDDNDDSKGSDMKHHNVFEQKDGGTPAVVLSHADWDTIITDASKTGSLKEAVMAFAENSDHLEHGIQDIDTLFPEARTLADSPELFSRRTEWVSSVLAKVRKSPFARIKTVSADLTVQEARAKGYITGALKKEEFFRVSKRITTPQTIYKKQKLDRDDMIDITDFDVVTWLKGEMRLMLDEELARAILLGDGRDPADEDKINEDHIRPVATDHELYTTVVNVNIGDDASSHREILDAIIRNRKHLRGSGLPTMYTTETVIAEFMLLKDGVNRRLYNSLAEVAAELRVDSIVPVEVMEEYPDLLAILVNLGDYVVGADKGGNVSMFDDFDIDFNQYKYLIETRASGALVKLKAALVIKRTAAGDALVVPAAPDFDGEEITINDTAGVVYRRADTDAVVTSAAPVAVAEGTSITIVAEPEAGKFFESSEVDDWTFTNNA